MERDLSRDIFLSEVFYFYFLSDTRYRFIFYLLSFCLFVYLFVCLFVSGFD